MLGFPQKWGNLFYFVLIIKLYILNLMKYSITLIILIIFGCFLDISAQAKIDEISFHGNSRFSKSELTNFMVTREDLDLNPSQLDLDLISVRQSYKKNGYLFARIDSSVINYTSDSAYASIDIYLNEGPEVEVGRIDIRGNNRFTDSRLMELFETKPGEVLNEGTLNSDISELLAYYEENGMPFAKAIIAGVSVYEEGGRKKLEIGIDIDENSEVTIDEVKIRGNEVTNKEVILRELKLPKDKRITNQTLDDIKDRLEKLDIFSEVKTPKIYTVKGEERSGLLIEVVEGNTSTFDGIIGYVPPQDGEEDGYFTGLVNLSFRNLFGTGRKIDARWQQEVRETQELQFKYYEPYIFNYPVSIGVGFLQRIQDTTYTRRNFDLRGDYILSEKFTISGLVGYDRVIPADGENNVLIIADSRIFLSGVEILFDNRDDVYFPTSGQLYRTTYTYGDKKIFNLDELGPLGYKDNYSLQRYSLSLNNYFSFFKRTALVVRVFGGEVRGDRLEESDLFRLGGNTTVRGYREEQFLASRLAYSNVEMRLALTRRNYLFAFYDFGYFERPADEINNFPGQNEFIYGYGAGITIETALGQIGVSYALGKGDGILDGKIHFGLVNSF